MIVHFFNKLTTLDKVELNIDLQSFYRLFLREN